MERALYLFYCSQNVILCVLFIPGKKDNCILRSRLQMQTSSIRLSHWPRWSWPCRAQGGCRRWGSSCRSPRPTETSSWGPETISCKQGKEWEEFTWPSLLRPSSSMTRWPGSWWAFKLSIYNLATSSTTVVSITIITITISITIITIVINLMICHLLCGFPWTSLWSGAQQLHGRHRPDRLARIWTGRHFVKTFNSRKIN